MLAFGEYTAGTPAGDDFGRANATADQAMISRLPMRLLGNPAGGLLAFVGHVDMIWAFSFLAADGTPSIEAFSGFISTLMNGGTVGLAMQSFRMRAARLIAATLDFFSLDPNNPSPTPTQLVKNRLIAAKDMRNYIILGDPAVAFNLEPPEPEATT